MKNIIFLFIIFLLVGNSSTFSQVDDIMKDPAAKEILDKLSAKAETYQTIRVKFDYIIDNRQTEETDTYHGTMFMKGEKYKIFLMGNEIFYNGNFMATFMIEEKEVTYATPDFDDENAINPADLFTIYNRDFKYLYLGDLIEENVTYQGIDLVPAKQDIKSYSKIRLLINKQKTEIYSIIYFGKDGVNFIIQITEFTPNVVVNDQLFNFNEAAFPDVEVIDLRD